MNRTTIKAKLKRDPPSYPPWHDIEYHHLLRIPYIIWDDGKNEMDKHGIFNR